MDPDVQPRRSARPRRPPLRADESPRRRPPPTTNVALQHQQSESTSVHTSDEDHEEESTANSDVEAAPMDVDTHSPAGAGEGAGDMLGDAAEGEVNVPEEAAGGPRQPAQEQPNETANNGTCSTACPGLPS